MDLKRTIYPALAAVALFFLLAGCAGAATQPDGLESPSGRLSGTRGNWLPDGSYRIDLRDAHSAWDYANLMAERTGLKIQTMAVPRLTGNLAFLLCRNLGMNLARYDGARKVVVCVGV